MSDWATTYVSCASCTAYFLPSRWTTKRCDDCLATCAADGCDRPTKTAGFCAAHYWRHAKKGEAGSAYIRPARGNGKRSGPLGTVAFTCQGCGGAFEAPRSIAVKDGTLTRKFCTKACMVASLDPRPTFECAYCGETKVRRKDPANQGYMYSQKHCSRACYLACCELKRLGGFVGKGGYRYITIDGKDVPEHRLVMAGHIGRDLFANETVHHKDGDRLNNALGNLELWSSRHGRGQRVEDKIGFCKSFLSDYGIGVIPSIDQSLLLAGVMGCL